MTDEIEIIPAVTGQKNKASTYNENFNRMKNYVISSVETLEAETQSTLSLYQTVNTLATSGTIALTDNSINTIIPQGEVTFTLPTITGEEAGKFHQILVQIKINSGYFGLYTINVGTNYYFNKIRPTFPEAGIYNLIYEYNALLSDSTHTYWTCGVVQIGTES